MHTNLCRFLSNYLSLSSHSMIHPIHHFRNTIRPHPGVRFFFFLIYAFYCVFSYLIFLFLLYIVTDVGVYVTNCLFICWKTIHLKLKIKWSTNICRSQQLYATLIFSGDVSVNPWHIDIWYKYSETSVTRCLNPLNLFQLNDSAPHPTFNLAQTLIFGKDPFSNLVLSINMCSLCLLTWHTRWFVSQNHL